MEAQRSGIGGVTPDRDGVDWRETLAYQIGEGRRVPKVVIS
ncbi:hypothetical protein RISK_002826 [Rhodopirellula islandica]|uniref:Uncharacterized protein n=1 Tax=Rhodopirellula islandica TaxID=595434 RepID=A0A0J1EHN8_RHOIS|nr:hypothetical protein RISK_002826 [Rhodopirellula islandica]